MHWQRLPNARRVLHHQSCKPSAGDVEEVTRIVARQGRWHPFALKGNVEAQKGKEIFDKIEAKENREIVIALEAFASLG